MVGKGAGGDLSVVHMPACVYKPAIDSEQEKTRRTQQISEFLQDDRQVAGRNVQQAIQGIQSVKRARWKIQIQKIHDLGVQPFFQAQGDHIGGKISTDDIQAIVLEEKAISSCAGSDF